MKAFTFRLETLLHLRVMAKDRAIKDYACAISKREELESQLTEAVGNLKMLNNEIHLKRTVGFAGSDQQVFNQSILLSKEMIIDLNSKLRIPRTLKQQREQFF